MVREVEPPRPSTKVSSSEALPSIAASRDIGPEQLKRALRGDLDWIVMKAIEKDRAWRYETANGFAIDVMRHLAHEPVQAAPPSRGYRVRKFVRKHRAAVVAAALVVASLVGGMAGTTWGLIRAERARRAEAKHVVERDDALVKAERARAAEAKRVVERDDALVKADADRRTADARAEEVAHRLGVNEIVLASAAYEKGDLAAAAERLSNVPPDQRGWEWRYLARMTRGGLFTLYGHTGAVRSVAFSPDGTRIVIGSDDHAAKVWDALTGMPIVELKGNTAGILSVAFSPDGKRIVTGSKRENAFEGQGSPAVTRVWDAKTGRPLLDMKGHTEDVLSVAFSPDGTRILTGDGFVRGWSVMPKEAVIWDAGSGKRLLGIKGHIGNIHSVAFSPDGNCIVTGGQNSTANVWDARSGRLLLELEPYVEFIYSVAFSPDGTRIVTGGGFHDSQQKVSHEAKFWAARTGTQLLVLKGHTSKINSVAFSPDGRRIVTGSGDSTAKVWDARSGKLLLELKGHTLPVTSVAFSADGMHVMTGSEDTTAKVWDVWWSGWPIIELCGPETSPVTFQEDGTRTLTISDALRGYDARSSTALVELKGQNWGHVAISPDGTRILTGGLHDRVRVWDARTGRPLVWLTSHTDKLTTSIAFSPDGTSIVTAASAGDATSAEVRLWDARTGTPLLDLKNY